MKSIKVKLTFTEPVLGSAPNNPEVYKQFIAIKYQKWLEKQRKSNPKLEDRGTADEIAALPPMSPDDEKGITVFSRLLDETGHRTETPCIWDNHVRGFLKSAGDAMNRVSKKGGDAVANPKAYKKTVDQSIFVYPRQIALQMPEGGEISFLQRPLRAQTMQGDRTALACSEMVPAGTTAELEIVVLSEADGKWVKGLLQYGMLSGMSQWRNGSYGRFLAEVVEEKEVDMDYIAEKNKAQLKIYQALAKAEAEDKQKEAK